MTGKGKRRGKKARKKKGRKKSKAEARNQRIVDFAMIAMLGLAVYFAILGGEYTVFEVGRLQKLQKESAIELASTEAEIDSLAALAARLRDDPIAIERVARERYGMIRDGEILYRFRETAPLEETPIDGEKGPE